jgi:DNA polymerase-3 subunit epsilon
MGNTFCVVDIEATGGNQKQGRIMEVGIVKVRHGQIVDEMSTLINPGKPIDKFVSKLTGITDHEVRQAPVFAEAAPRILEFLGDGTFVGHNAAFDYSYLRLELHRAGFEYQADQICTIDLSKKLFPNELSYSLGKLCRSLGLDVSLRHRALGDARCTSLLFLRLLDQVDAGTAIQSVIRRRHAKGIVGATIISAQNGESTDELPDDPGILRVMNDQQQVLYAGRGDSIRITANRFRALMSKSPRFEPYRNQLATFNYELTGNALLAELKFYDLVYNQRPVLNLHLSQLEYRYCLGIYFRDDQPLLAISRGTVKPAVAIAYFKDFKSGERLLNKLITKYKLGAHEVIATLYRPRWGGNRSGKHLRDLLHEGLWHDVAQEADTHQPKGCYMGLGPKPNERVLFMLSNKTLDGIAMVDKDMPQDLEEAMSGKLQATHLADAAKICWYFIANTNHYQKLV